MKHYNPSHSSPYYTPWTAPCREGDAFVSNDNIINADISVHTITNSFCCTVWREEGKNGEGGSDGSSLLKAAVTKFL